MMRIRKKKDENQEKKGLEPALTLTHPALQELTLDLLKIVVSFWKPCQVDIK